MLAEQRYVLVVEYDGLSYAGFQIQKNANTIQAEIERALSIFLRRKMSISFAGRTDAGVHAVGQVVSFCTNTTDLKTDRIVSALNGLLPKEIVIHAAAAVAHQFHPRYSCAAREYRYLIWNAPVPTALWRGRSLWHRRQLDLQQINQQLRQLVGSHDFAAFAHLSKNRGSTTRRIYKAKAKKQGALISVQICANSFLHHMIRVIIGTLLDLSSGRIGCSIADILASRDRQLAGSTAAAGGLYLYRAYYPADISPPACLSIWKNFPS